MKKKLVRSVSGTILGWKEDTNTFVHRLRSLPNRKKIKKSK